MTTKAECLITFEAGIGFVTVAGSHVFSNHQLSGQIGTAKKKGLYYEMSETYACAEGR